MAGVDTTPTQVFDPYGRVNTPHNAFFRIEQSAGRTYRGGPYSGEPYSGNSGTARLGQASDGADRVNSNRSHEPGHEPGVPAASTISDLVYDAPWLQSHFAAASPYKPEPEPEPEVGVLPP